MLVTVLPRQLLDDRALAGSAALIAFADNVSQAAPQPLEVMQLLLDDREPSLGYAPHVAAVCQRSVRQGEQLRDFLQRKPERFGSPDETKLPECSRLV